MAKAKKSAKATDSAKTTVTRVKAKDDRKPKAAAKPKAPNKQAELVVNGEQGEPKKNIFQKFIGYFKGAWYELRQVRWPNRRATFGMTAALLIFTGLFSGFILLTDLAWENLFKLLLG